MEREEKPVCNTADFYAEGLLAQMSDLMAVILHEILYLKGGLYISVPGVLLSRWEAQSGTDYV